MELWSEWSQVELSGATSVTAVMTSWGCAGAESWTKDRMTKGMSCVVT